MLTALAAAVLASLLTAAILRGLTVHREIAAHDRRIAEIDEDMRRWVRDRDRGRIAELQRVTDENNARGLLHSGPHAAGLVIVAKRVREEWRNELSTKLREFARMAGEEGRMHELVRRRRRDGRPALELPEDVREKLAIWRGPIPVPGQQPVALDDPMSSQLEPDLAEFERCGRRELPSIDLRTGTPRV